MNLPSPKLLTPYEAAREKAVREKVAEGLKPKPSYKKRLASLLASKRADLKALETAKPPPPKHHTKPVAKEVVKDASGRSFNREGDKTSPTSPTTSTTTPTSPTSPTTSTTTPTTSPKTTTKFSISRPVTPPERPRNPPTPPATPAAIASTTTPKRSRLPSPTPKIIPKRVETASTTCPLTPPATPTPMLRKPQKPHLTIDDLVRMFAGKPRPFGLPQHQNRRPSPQSLGTRQSGRPSSPYYQSRITAYFLPVANQKPPISQGLKSPKPKSFQQHTPAEPIPRCRPALPEKSAFSPYKKPGISYTKRRSWQSRSSPRSSFAWPSHTAPPLLGSPPPDPHVCCTCFGHSSFRDGLFNYRRPSQQNPSNRRPMRGMMG